MLMTKDKQSALYDKAMHFVNSGEFKKALGPLEQVASGPNVEMAHAARIHKATCERRLAAVSVKLESADDYYNYGIAQINQRDLDGAQDNLLKALAKSENADHVHYALALCYGLSKDIEKAAEHLGQAIAIAPRNRAAARNDSDFESIVAEPEIRALLHPERSQAE